MRRRSVPTSEAGRVRGPYSSHAGEGSPSIGLQPIIFGGMYRLLCGHKVGTATRKWEHASPSFHKKRLGIDTIHLTQEENNLYIDARTWLQDTPVDQSGAIWRQA